ncbi:Sodium-dependent glucose transporter 1 [Mizuhopecten yessoensis]|uniref:Sodium-dependent glucose transporter 1 n=1 Tax=Mizuhopecten yessoensis TaxID=6573 RepID=A0A210PTZ5_MIZYE|nr:Sodium-dependent glucose transporter 1 [Mizuhopecten yessoensis]
MFSVALIIMGVAIATVPWCVMIEAMLPTYLIVGLMQGIIDTGGNAEVLQVWKQEGRVVVLGLNFVFAVGSVIAPLVVAPFLIELKDEGLKNTSSSSLWDRTSNDIFYSATSLECYITDTATSNPEHFILPLGCWSCVGRSKTLSLIFHARDDFGDRTPAACVEGRSVKHSTNPPICRLRQ